MRSSHLLGSSRAGLASSAVLLRIEFTAMDVIANREMKLSDGVEIFNAFLESKSNKIIVDCQH